MGSLVTSYVKRPHSWYSEPEELVKYHTNIELQQELIKYLYRWNELFTPDYGYLRDKISLLANDMTGYPNDDGRSEWLAIRDDDDIHLRVDSSCFDVEPDIVLIGFNVQRYWLIPTPDLHLEIEICSYLRGCYSCGMVVRRSFFDQLTREQRRLLMGDHYKAHAFVHFMGYRYVLHSQTTLAISVTHPLSASAAQMLGDPLVAFPDRERLQQFIRDAPLYVQQVGEIFLNCQRK